MFIPSLQALLPHFGTCGHYLYKGLTIRTNFWGLFEEKFRCFGANSLVLLYKRLDDLVQTDLVFLYKSFEVMVQTGGGFFVQNLVVRHFVYTIKMVLQRCTTAVMTYQNTKIVLKL